MNVVQQTWLFDIDGTLLTAGGAGSLAIAEVLRDGFDIAVPNIDVVFSGRTDRGILTEIARRNGLSTDDATIDRFMHLYCNAFATTIQQTDGRLFDGAGPLAERARRDPRIESRVMTGNCERTGWHKLKHFGLADQFEVVHGGDADCERNHLARRTYASLDPALTAIPLVVIGDTPADIVCAREIDAVAVAVATGRYDLRELRSIEPDLTLRNFDEESFGLIFETAAAIGGAPVG